MESMADMMARAGRESAERIKTADAESLLAAKAFVLGEFDDYFDDYIERQRAELERGTFGQFGSVGTIAN